MMKKFIILAIIIIIIVLILIYLFRRKVVRKIKLAMSEFKYFTYDEFDSPDEKGSGKKMKSETIRMLDIARECATKEKGKDLPFVIESGFRTESYNKKTSGVKGSAHTRGYAVDIDYKTKQDKEIMLRCLIKAGFNRFGIREGKSGTSIHVDNDPTKPKFAVWGYNDKNGNLVQPVSPWTYLT